MSETKPKRKREIYDIESLCKEIEKNSSIMDPFQYTDEKMPVFAANVNLKRQIPELKDGLIPLHRRILMTMYLMGLYNGKKTKSLQVVGEIAKKLHPHGDSTIYGGIICLSQPWRNNIHLIDGKGNFGTAYDANAYADQRYTECGMSDFAYDCYFADWKPKNINNDMVVDWIPNYDESDLEPMYLPCKYPMFLVTWRRAMGIGKYCSLIGFNFSDACNAIIKLIKDPDAKFTIYPDDPEGCDIVNGKDLNDIIDSTDISVRVRSKYSINHYNGKDIIEISSTPFEVNPIVVKESIKAAVEKGKLPEISDIDGSSENFGKEFVLSIEVRKGYDPNEVMNKIFKLTQAANTYIGRYSFVNGLQPIECTIRIAALEWIRTRRETLKRIYKSKRVIIIKRIHFLTPLIKVIESGQIDDFIKIVRKNTKTEAIQKIMDKWKLTDYQAEKIVDVKISDLSKDKLQQYKDELNELTIEESELAKITSGNASIDEIIIEQMKEGIKKYGYERRSSVYQVIETEQIADTNHYLIFTNSYIKKLPYDDKGYKIGRLDTNEKVIKVMIVNNRDSIAIFTEDGRCTPVKVSDIGNSNVQSIGISYTQCGTKGRYFVDAINVSIDDMNDKYIVSVSENGLISRTQYSEIETKNKSFVLMKLDDGDRMVSVTSATEDDKLIVYTKSGKIAMFPCVDFESSHIGTKGVQSAKLASDDKMSGVSCITTGHDNLILLTDRGYVKKVKILNMPSTKRNGRVIELNSSGGTIVDIKSISNESEDPLFICTTNGTYILDHLNIKSTARLGKPERAAELKSSDYAFELL